MVASNSDSGVIWILFLWLEFMNHFGVCNLLSLVNRDVFISSHKEFVSSCNRLSCASRFSTNTLIESSKFIGI